MKRFGILSAFLATSLMSAPALAQNSGELASARGGPANVLVTRDGEVYPILAGDPIYEGDIISTRSGGSAVISAFGCRVELGSSEQIVVDENFCEPSAVTVASLPDAVPSNDGLVTRNRLLIGAGAAGVIAAIALSQDDDDDAPVSP